MFSRDEMQRAIEDALKSMEGVALELYRRGREEAREELETVKRERDEARASVADAYRRGAEAMREHCIGMACAQDLDLDAQDRMEERLRALPIPEEP